MEWPKVQELLYRLKAGWHVNPQGHLERAYTFPDFAQGTCKVEIWTHKISGLTESDFYLAAKADRALESISGPTV
jgi:4a-hydroxytetrahydrobiopterin dehydratase